MNRPIIFATVALIAASAFAWPTKCVRKQLEENYAFFAKSWKKKDLEPTYKYMTDDFTAVGMEPGGKVIDRDTMIERTKQLLAADGITWPRKVLSVKVHGETAVAIVDGHFTGMMPTGQAGKAQKFELIAKTKDTWVRIGREWKFKKMEIVESKVMIDGKVVGN